MSIKAGQTVQVIPGQKDEETGTSLAGWSGRIIEYYPKYDTVEIEWDSITLLNMPDTYIRFSLDEGYDYLKYTLQLSNASKVCDLVCKPLINFLPYDNTSSVQPGPSSYRSQFI